MISLDSININNTDCTYSGFPVTMRIGDIKQITCTNINASGKYDYDLSLDWTNLETSAQYTQNDSKARLIGKVNVASLSAVEVPNALSARLLFGHN